MQKMNLWYILLIVIQICQKNWGELCDKQKNIDVFYAIYYNIKYIALIIHFMGSKGGTK